MKLFHRRFDCGKWEVIDEYVLLAFRLSPLEERTDGNIDERDSLYADLRGITIPADYLKCNEKSQEHRCHKTNYPMERDATIKPPYNFWYKHVVYCFVFIQTEK